MSIDDDREQIGRAARAARLFASLGWNALPSRHDRKGPALARYADYWEAPLPAAILAGWRAHNVQVMTGARWRLAVVDCDGDEAHTVWRQMKADHAPAPIGPWPTWVARTGGGGWHYWFTLPAWLDECASGRLWGLWDTRGGPQHRGDWRKHQEVRLLADRALVIAPPSVHVETGRAYEWVAGRSPADFAKPAPAPGWLLELPRLGTPAFGPADRPAIIAAARAPRRPATAFRSREDVLDAVPDKVALAASWGLRIAAPGANASGWVACHAIDRADRTPSASISEVSGVYSERREGTSLSLFDLGVALGRFADWEECKDAVAEAFLPRAPSRACAPARGNTGQHPVTVTGKKTATVTATAKTP